MTLQSKRQKVTNFFSCGSELGLKKVWSPSLITINLVTKQKQAFALTLLPSSFSQFCHRLSVITFLFDLIKEVVLTNRIWPWPANLRNVQEYQKSRVAIPNYSSKYIQVFKYLPWLQTRALFHRRKKYLSFKVQKLNIENEYWFPMPSCWIRGDGSVSQGKWTVWSCEPVFFPSNCQSPWFLLSPELCHCELRNKLFFKFSCYLGRVMSCIKPLHHRVGKSEQIISVKAVAEN